MNRLPAILLALGLLALPASAALTAALAPAVQNAARGTELVFSGTLTNTSATDKVFLNDIHATLDGSAATHLVLKPNEFFAHVPGILLPGESYTGPLFRLALGGGAPTGDFTGTIVFDGGADIFAMANLASAGFVVLSPDVSIVASDASASEFGPDNGAFRITRTGRTDIALSVPYTNSGTAVNGTTYAAIPTSIVIAAGADFVAINVTPIPDNLAQGDRNATLTLAASSAFNPGNPLAATVTVHDKPADQWRLEKFGAAANDPGAQDLADWDFDGIKNVLEYALDLDPKTANPSALPKPVPLDGYPTFSYVPNPSATDLFYEVEASGNLVYWSVANLELVTVENPEPPNRITVRYNTPISLLDHIFFKLRATRLATPP